KLIRAVGVPREALGFEQRGLGLAHLLSKKIRPADRVRGRSTRADLNRSGLFLKTVSVEVFIHKLFANRDARLSQRNGLIEVSVAGEKHVGAGKKRGGIAAELCTLTYCGKNLVHWRRRHRLVAFNQRVDLFD